MAQQRQMAYAERRISYAERERRRRRRLLKRRIVCGMVVIGTICVALLLTAIIRLLITLFSTSGLNLNDRVDARDGGTKPADIYVEALSKSSREKIQGLPKSIYEKHPDWTEDFLTVNEYSRPGDALGEVKNIFVHYTANKGTSAAQNRSYFEQLKDTHERSASAHFIIGYEGEIIQCVPLDEIAYAVQTRNYDSISIECCYLSDDGSFTKETYSSLLGLLDWLLEAYGLESEDVLRHYDCGGKKCPVYYVEHEKAWERLKKDVGER